MAFIKCKQCNNHYSDQSCCCPFCYPSLLQNDTASSSIVYENPFELIGTDLTELQKRMVIKATDDVHRKGKNPLRSKAKDYLHDSFEWSLYNRWHRVFAHSTGLEQWPEAHSYYHFEHNYHSKDLKQVLIALTRKQLLALFEEILSATTRMKPKGYVVKEVLRYYDNTRVRSSALTALRLSHSQKAQLERKDLFSSWLYYGTSLKEKLADWKEFDIQRVEISPSAGSCDHCRKLTGKEVHIDQVLPLLLQHHPGCRCEVVLAKSEFSRLT